MYLYTNVLLVCKCTCFSESLLFSPCFCKASICLSEGDIFRVAVFMNICSDTVPSSVIYVNELTIAAISEYMKEMETSSFPIFISSNLYSLLICIWLESHPQCFTQVGVAGEGSAAEQCLLLALCGCTSAFPLQWGARQPAQLGQGVPQGLHLCRHRAGILNWTLCRISSCSQGI